MLLNASCVTSSITLSAEIVKLTRTMTNETKLVTCMNKQRVGLQSFTLNTSQTIGNL